MVLLPRGESQFSFYYRDSGPLGRYNDPMPKVLRRDSSWESEALNALASSDLFASFSPDDLALLTSKSDMLVLKDKDRLFSAGDAADRLYAVVEGSIVMRNADDGSVMAAFIAGEVFGELKWFTRTLRNANAESDGPSRVLAFPASGAPFRESLADEPELAARVLRSFLLVLSSRTRVANSLIAENSPWIRELRRQVYGDKLTGLLNKIYLDEHLPSMLGDSPVALIMMKPDNFKDINDRFGHEVGDAVLVLMAKTLEREVGKSGTVARYLGNELTVVLPGSDRAAALEEARRIQERLQALDLAPLTGVAGLGLGVSLGIALYPEHGTCADALVSACVSLPLVARGRGGKLVLFPEDAP